MTQERMLELFLLSRYYDAISGLGQKQITDLSQTYDLDKLMDRTKELEKEFLSPYVIVKSSKGE